MLSKANSTLDLRIYSITCYNVPPCATISLSRTSSCLNEAFHEKDDEAFEARVVVGVFRLSPVFLTSRVVLFDGRILRTALHVERRMVHMGLWTATKVERRMPLSRWRIIIQYKYGVLVYYRECWV